MIEAVALIEPQGFVRRDAFGYCEPLENSTSVRLRIIVDDWLADDVDLLQFDAAVHRLEDAHVPFCLVLEGPHVPGQVVTQVLTRYQRLLPLTGAPSSSPVLRALGSHRALFDLSKPLVRADYDHALDTWRWVLRLDPNASLELQLAALFHDIERLSSEAEQRIEHLAADYPEFKRCHAAASAEYLDHFLNRIGFPPGVVQRVRELVRLHEQPRKDTELGVLNDADSLSFFSLNSWGFVRYFGEEHTRTKVRYTLQRMSHRARALLPTLRQHPCVTNYLCQYAGPWS